MLRFKGERVVVCCRKKNAQERIRNWRRGVEGRTSNHKLNITDWLTDKIILMVTQLAILSVKISCHHMICLLESHCNTLRNVAGIYWQKFFVSIFTDRFYRRVNFIDNVVCKTYMLSYYLVFLFLFFPLQFPWYVP